MAVNVETLEKLERKITLSVPCLRSSPKLMLA
jgi:hypothetical protein